MSTDAKPELTRVVVGRIGRPHGVRGDVSIDVRTDEPDQRFAVGQSLIAGDPASRNLTVTAMRWHSGRLLVTFDSITDRTMADSVRGSILEATIDPSELPSGQDEYFDRQLEGLRAVTLDGVQLGKIDAVLHLPAQDVLSIKAEDDTEILIPFLELFVPEVDLAAGTLTVSPPPGLIGVEETIDHD